MTIPIQSIALKKIIPKIDNRFDPPVLFIGAAESGFVSSKFHSMDGYAAGQSAQNTEPTAGKQENGTRQRGRTRRVVKAVFQRELCSKRPDRNVSGGGIGMKRQIRLKNCGGRMDFI